MKLAEALVSRADMQKRLEQLRERLRLSAVVQEGEQPPEDTQELLAEVARLIADMMTLIPRINSANLSTTLPDGTTLTAALARRDMLDMHHSVLKTAVDATASRIDRYSRSEIRKVAAVDVSALRRQMDTLAQQRRELDTAIQATNWTTELPE